MREDADDHEQFVSRVAFHERQEGSIERVRDLDLVGVLPEEQNTLVDQLADDQAENLAQISAGDEFLWKRERVVDIRTQEYAPRTLARRACLRSRR